MNILTNAGTSVLSQANSQGQAALKLLGWLYQLISKIIDGAHNMGPFLYDLYLSNSSF
jgi:hypothetical protein